MLLSVRNLSVAFGPTRVLDALDLDIAPGESLGIVGESGSGKSMTALAVMGLLPPGGSVAAGSIRLDGTELVGMAESKLAHLRGTRMAMIFQEPMTSLNPVLSVGEQIAEVLRHHRGMSHAAARAEAARLLAMVEIPDAARRVAAYPHELSGGQRQRAMIAIALACRPALLIADEPTTALDATVQAGILDLLRGLRRELGMAVLLITHDLGVISDFAERVLVLYAGRVAETAPASRLFATPSHPYTQALLSAIPRISGPIQKLPSIPGAVPLPYAMPPGCRFAPRCAHAVEACATQPPMHQVAEAHHAACVRAA